MINMLGEIKSGDDCMKVSNHVDALNHYKKAADIFPCAKSLYSLGHYYYSDKQYEKAESVLKRALNEHCKQRDDKDKFMVAKDLGLCELKLKEYDNARKVFGLAISVTRNLQNFNPDHELKKGIEEIRPALATATALVKFNDGKVCEDRKEYKNAAFLYNESINAWPSEEAYFHSGLCRMELKDYENALCDIEKAFNMRYDKTSVHDKFMIECLINKGICLMETAQYEKSRDELESAYDRSKPIGDHNLTGKAKFCLDEINKHLEKTKRVASEVYVFA